MKTKPKQPVKKSVKPAKVTLGISRTTQITFIVTAIAAYVLQATQSIQGLFSIPNVLESFTRWFPVYLIDGIVLPLVLFTFAYFALNNSSSRVSRIFRATLVATIGGMVSMMTNMLAMELFKEQLRYDGGSAIWVGTWVQLGAVIIGLLGAACIAWYVFRPVKDKEFTTSRKVQKTFIGLVAFTILTNILFGVANMINGSNGGYMSSNEALAAFALSILALVVPVGILYLIASKAQTKLTRLFNALLYLLISIFISGIVFTIMYSFKIYMHEAGSFGAILMPVLTYVILIGVVAVHKLQKAF